MKIISDEHFDYITPIRFEKLGNDKTRITKVTPPNKTVVR